MFKRLVNMPLKNGMFFFTGSCTKNECSEVLVRGEGPGFPGTSLSVWVEPDARIVIKGKDRLYTDWRIESNVEEQKVMETFLEER